MSAGMSDDPTSPAYLMRLLTAPGPSVDPWGCYLRMCEFDRETWWKVHMGARMLLASGYEAALKRGEVELAELMLSQRFGLPVGPKVFVDREEGSAAMLG